MAGINREILFYLIWTKLLVWTRCPQRAGTQPPQPRWARSGPQICHCDHGVHMNPWFFNSSPFMQQIRSTSLLSLDLILDPETVSQEEPDLFYSFFLCCICLACLHVLGKLGREQKENREHVNAEKDMIGESDRWSNYWDVVGCQRPWILRAEVLACGVVKHWIGLWFLLLRSKSQHNLSLLLWGI